VDTYDNEMESKYPTKMYDNSSSDAEEEGPEDKNIDDAVVDDGQDGKMQVDELLDFDANFSDASFSKSCYDQWHHPAHMKHCGGIGAASLIQSRLSHPKARIHICKIHSRLPCCCHESLYFVFRDNTCEPNTTLYVNLSLCGPSMREGECARALYFPSRFSLDSQSARIFDHRCVFVCTCMQPLLSDPLLMQSPRRAAADTRFPPELVAVLMREGSQQACHNAQRAAHTATHALAPQSPRACAPRRTKSSPPPSLLCVGINLRPGQATEEREGKTGTASDS